MKFATIKLPEIFLGKTEIKTMEDQIKEIEVSLLSVKTMLRQIAVTNWKSVEQIDSRLPDLNSVNKIPQLKKHLDEIKSGLALYKKSLDAVILILS